MSGGPHLPPGALSGAVPERQTAQFLLQSGRFKFGSALVSWPPLRGVKLGPCVLEKGEPLQERALEQVWERGVSREAEQASPALPPGEPTAPARTEPRPLQGLCPTLSPLLPSRLGASEAPAFDGDESEAVGATRVQVALK